MKKYSVLVLFSIALLILAVSCGNSVNGGKCGRSNPGYIDVYSSGGAKGLLDGLDKKTVTVASRIADEAVFRQIEKEYADGGRTILGLVFRNIESITGRFSLEEEGTPDLKSLTFDSALKLIDALSFRYSRKLESVVFGGKKVPVIDAIAFPDKDDYTSKCAFEVPAASKDEYKEILDPFINDKGYLKILTKVKFDANGLFYSSDPNFGTPSIGTAEISAYTGSAVDSIDAPSLDGWTFTGYFADSNTTATQIFTADGNVLPSADGYTDEDAIWTCEDDITLYAHWEKNKYTVTIISNDEESGTVDAEEVSNVEFGAVIIVNGNELTIPTVSGSQTVTAVESELTTATAYAFDSWSGVPGKVAGNVTITAVFTSSTNPGFTPVVVGDTVVDLDLGFDSNNAKHTFNGISVVYNSTSLGVVPSVPSDTSWTSVEGFYADKNFEVKVADSTGAFVLNVNGYTDGTGWNYTGSDNPVVLYVKWN